MEAGGVSTPDQIFESTTRRSSFSFCTLGETPLAAIMCTHKLMAGAKEAYGCDPYSQWKYMPIERRAEMVLLNTPNNA